MKILFLKFTKNIVSSSLREHQTSIVRFSLFFFFTFQFFPIKLDRWTVSMIDVESVKQPSNRWLLISAPLPLPLSLVITLSPVIAFSLNFYCTAWRQFLTPKYFPPTITRHLGLKPTPSSPTLVRVYTRHYMHQREIWFLGWAREKYNKSSR